MYHHPSIRETATHFKIMYRALKEFPYLFGGDNDYDKCSCHGLKYYIPRDLMTLKEIYVDEYYGDSFKGKILDMGSNTGLFCFYALQHGASEIIAYEPFEPVYNTMINRIETLNETRIKPYNELVYDKNGVVPYCGQHTIGHVGKSGHYVKASKASDIVDCTFSAIKMDVEGSEYPIIKDLYDCDKLRNVSTYFVEIHDQGMTRGRVHDVFDMFRSSGFHITRDITLLDDPYVHMLHFHSD